MRRPDPAALAAIILLLWHFDSDRIGGKKWGNAKKIISIYAC